MYHRYEAFVQLPSSALVHFPANRERHVEKLRRWQAGLLCEMRDNEKWLAHDWLPKTVHGHLGSNLKHWENMMGHHFPYWNDPKMVATQHFRTRPLGRLTIDSRCGCTQRWDIQLGVSLKTGWIGACPNAHSLTPNLRVHILGVVALIHSSPLNLVRSR